LRPLAGSFPCYRTKGFLRLRPEVAVGVAGPPPVPPTAADRCLRVPPVAVADLVVLATAALFVAFVFIAVPRDFRCPFARGGWFFVPALRFDMAALCEAAPCGSLTDSRSRAAATHARLRRAVLRL